MRPGHEFEYWLFLLRLVHNSSESHSTILWKTCHLLLWIQITFWMTPGFHRVIKWARNVYAHRKIPQISLDPVIPLQTLRDWHDQRSQEDDQNWFPLAQGHPHARALSDANEAGITDFIRVNHIRSGKWATRGLLQSLCLDSYVPEKCWISIPSDLVQKAWTIV
jgi:hypothetical protein